MPSIFNTVSMVNGKLVQFDDMLVKYLSSGSIDPTPVPPRPPVDPYNPLGLPPFTIRVKFSSGYTPSMGDSQTLVDAGENVWDIYKNSTDWESLFRKNSDVIAVLGANTTGVTYMGMMFSRCTSITTIPLFDTSNVTRMAGMFSECTSLTTIPLFDTSNVTQMNMTFSGCTSVNEGALALYQQASTQSTPPDHDETFKDCGSNTTSGRAELAQIPTSWGGLKPDEDP